MNFKQTCKLVNPVEKKKSPTGKKIARTTAMYFQGTPADKEGSKNAFIDVEGWEEAAVLLSNAAIKTEICLEGNIVQQRWKSKDGKLQSKFILNVKAISAAEPRQKKEKAAVTSEGDAW